MEPRHPSPEQFRALGYRAVDWIVDYMGRVESLPVSPGIAPGGVASRLGANPPERGIGGGVEAWESIFEDMDRVIVPGLTHWQSPNFYAYFPCNASVPAILGEMLSAGLNVNGMLWATSPAATELEMRTLDWMARLIGLPAAFMSGGAGGGCIQGSASESALVAMVAARRRVLDRAGDGADAGPGGPVVYASTQAHSSVVKAAMIAGIARGPEDRERIRLVETGPDLAMDPGALAGAVREDLARGRLPCMVCATIGTTSSLAVDPLRRIAGALAECGFAERGGWLHVDAAHAGAACICPEFRWLLDGAELADSVCFNPHKWLLTNFDCDCFWTRDRAALVNALSITPEYLRTGASESGAVIDYRDWQVPLGRRFRALKLWLVVRCYGAEGLRAHIREHVRLAGLVEGFVRADPRFELAAPRLLNLVCFRLRGGPDADGMNRELLERLNAGGRLLLSHTVLPDGAGGPRYTLRMAIGATATRERHVVEAWRLIAAEADRLVAGGARGR